MSISASVPARPSRYSGPTAPRTTTAVNLPARDPHDRCNRAALGCACSATIQCSGVHAGQAGNASARCCRSPVNLCRDPQTRVRQRKGARRTVPHCSAATTIPTRLDTQPSSRRHPTRSSVPLHEAGSPPSPSSNARPSTHCQTSPAFGKAQLAPTARRSSRVDLSRLCVNSWPRTRDSAISKSPARRSKRPSWH